MTDTNMTSYRMKWDLDSFFEGGSHSKTFSVFLQETEELLQTWLDRSICNVTIAEWTLALNMLSDRLDHADSFVECLVSQDVNDEQALLLEERLQAQSVKYDILRLRLSTRLRELKDDEFAALLEEEALKPLAFVLSEMRQQAKDEMDLERESLVKRLAKDGYHAWQSVYDEAIGRMEIPFEEDGKTNMLSAEQLLRKLDGPDRTVRLRAFKAYEKAWGQEAPLFAQTLNRLAGFRLNLYEARGWSDVLQEPLALNRMQGKTLQTMWETITKNQSRFYRYMDAKATLLGVEKLHFHDVHAPLPSKNKGDNEVSYNEACDLIIRHFRKFSPKMADFAEMALRDGWVEAENRTGKRPGGFCTDFPLLGQSRIFMTYDGSMTGVAFLAHELGHAYHSWCLKNEPYALTREYPLSIAETASTLAEMMVADALVEEAEDNHAKKMMIENKLARALVYLKHVHATFLFETRFYEERKNGMVSQERLNELMVAAQQEAYGDRLATYDPNLWASVEHFHITSAPFYNFPYTFGYLFSLGVYAQALKSGTSFEDQYIALLKDSGSMTVEDLAIKHLGVNLTTPQFWQEALDVVLADVEKFLSL
ncbi:M3 family oligoendopeptidase [Shouchella lonarensis]|uniref:Oligoendopeptidase, pepF/M3 family n=1 Tax=Shouchella lonarensis TaxID=1464122 RepID=A0A1G6GII4_9BACI|nr:M3 family oligoendopeptidase [Shouchella lonarensis]SDB80996.1 oligoendopeptidase, pepF/M3 family [Shouchella lonarensis]